MKLDDSTDIVRVVMTNINTGEEVTLEEKPGSKCLFYKKFPLMEYYVQLRLDYGDIMKGQKGKNEEPTLDADVWTESNGKKTFLGKRNSQWHHTEKKFDKFLDAWVYKFKVENLELCLLTRKTVAKTLTSNFVIIDDSVSVSKNNLK